MIREFAEELRGGSEDYDTRGGPLDYDSWPLARQLTDALAGGQIRVWCLGLGVDPLTYATDLLTVAVIDGDVFDEVFSLRPRRNSEGSVLAAREFAAHVIDRTVSRDPLQAAGAAVLRLAWRHRAALGGLSAAIAAHHACGGDCWAELATSSNVVLRQMVGVEKWWYPRPTTAAPATSSSSTDTRRNWSAG
jgi:hypothetical protein